MPPERIKRLIKADEVAGNQLRPLVNQLGIGVLTVGTVRPQTRSSDN